MVGSKYPAFDARVFQVPKEEVANYFIWRQKDTTRNSIQMLGRHYFSHKQLHQKNASNIQDMLMVEHGVNWNDLDTWKKRGTCAVRQTELVSVPRVYPDGDDAVLVNTETVERSKITADEEIPIFTQDREYIERYL
jgi:tRNA(His) 5'-end guanylyltransferase